MWALRVCGVDDGCRWYDGVGASVAGFCVGCVASVRFVAGTLVGVPCRFCDSDAVLVCV